MALVSIGDLAQSLMLRQQNARARVDLTQLTATLTTGRVADAGAHLNGNLAPLAGLDASLMRLQGFGQVVAEAGRRASTLQDVLALADSAAGETGPALLAAGLGGSEAILTGAALRSGQALEQVVSALNTRIADRSLLSGTATDRPALVSADQLLSLAQTVTTGAQGAVDLERRLTDWMADPAGFAAQAYRGGPASADIPIAEGEVIRLDVTANDPAIKATLKSLLMGALLTRGALQGDPQARADLARRAGESLQETAPDRAHLAARLGVAEQRIAQAATRNSAEDATLTLARNGMVGVDGYDTATALQEAQSRLETLYTLTARLSRLNLASYL